MEIPRAPETESNPAEPVRRVIPKFSSFKPEEPSPPPPLPTESKDEKRKDSRHEPRRYRKPRPKSRERRGGRDGDRSLDGKEKRRDKESDGKDKRRDQYRESSDRHHQGRERRHRHRSPGSPSKGISLLRVDKPRTRSPSPESWDAPKKQYFADTRGDPHNVTYGTIHRYSVPEYRRHGAGSVIGLSPEIKIDRDKGDGKSIVLSSKRDRVYASTGKNARYAYAKAESEGVKMLRIKKEGEHDDKAFENGMDFVPISSKRKGKKRKNHPDSENEMSGKEEEDNHYRSIEGLKKSNNKPEDQDLEYVSSSDSESDYVSSRGWNDRRRNVELVKKVDAEPKNIDFWMEYVNHQDALLTGSRRRSTVAERTSTAEVKLDILSKALEKCPGNERLLVKYMDVAETIWDSRKILSKWQQVLKDNPTITGLWTKYINFRQTDFQSFTYQECLKCFSECLVVLRSAAFRAIKGLRDVEKLEDIILYVFLRAMLFMREAGYVGNAVGAFQSMLELNYFRPLHLLPPTTIDQHSRLLGELEEFWDSEILRVGETGAKGWASYVSSGRNGDVPGALGEDVAPEKLDPCDLFGSWMDAEEERIGLSTMPARTIDEVEDGDPFRVVLFSDVESFVFCFSSPVVRRKVADSFLVFSGLTPVYYVEPTASSSPESTDAFLRNDLAIMQESYLDEWFWPKGPPKPADIASLEGLSIEPERKRGLDDENPFQFGLKNFPSGPDSLFGGESGSWAGRVKRADFGFVGEALKMLVDGTGEERLAVYYLAWVWQNQPKSVKKVAKALLKKFTTSLLLWNGYAQVEWRDGKTDAARNIFSTALGMSKGFPEVDLRNAILLWRTWAWEELVNPSQAIRILLSVESGKLLPEIECHSFSPGNIPPALLLKSRRYLDEQQNLMMSMGHVYHAVVYNEVRALLEYLSRDQDIIATLSIYDSLIQELERRDLTGPLSAVHELCLMAKARLLYHHATTGKIFKMKIMRGALEEALAQFPNNSIFLGLYVWNEGRTKIENRVRTLMRDVVLKERKETVIGWAFAIWAEMRMVGSGGAYNVHAVRALLEQAVGCERTKSNIGLWMIYVEFEMREKDLRRAKEVFFRGVRCCPWSKDLALLAFRRLRPALDPEEMWKLLSMIASEKELRVHDTTELEDMIELGEGAKAHPDRLGGLGRSNLPDDDSEEEVWDED